MSTITPSPVQVVRHWLASGQAPAHRASEVARAMLLRDGQLPLGSASLRIGFGADIELALLLDAEVGSRADLVAFLADHANDKAVAKHAKKILFRFKQKGIEVPERAKGRAPVDLTSRPDPLPSFLTPLTEAGAQFCVLGGSQQLDNPCCIFAYLDDVNGLISCYALPVFSRTQQRELLARLRGTVGEVFEVPEALVSGRLRYGLDVLDARAGMCDGDLAEVRLHLAAAEAVSEVGFDIDPEDEERFATYLLESTSLAANRAFSGYFRVDPAQLDHRIQRISTENPQEFAAAVLSCKQDLLHQHIESLGALSIANRLEFNAWLLANSGNRVAALQALACARALRDGPHAWSGIGLARAANDMDDNDPLAPAVTTLLEADPALEVDAHSQAPHLGDETAQP